MTKPVEGPEPSTERGLPPGAPRSQAPKLERRVFRTLAWTLGVVMGLFILYLAAANIFLRTRLLRSFINEGPDQIWVDYRSAYTLWPGFVRVHGLIVRDRDIGAEWVLRADDVSLRISLFHLAARRFRPTRVRGSGMVFRARHRLDPEQATSERLSLLPPIDGLPDPPLKSPGEVEPAPTGREWTIHVTDLRLEPVREIWLNGYRYEGRASLMGEMMLRPKHHVEVGASSLVVHSGGLRFGEDAIAERLEGVLDWIIHPCDLKAHPGNAVFEFVTGEAKLDGRVENIRFLNTLLATHPYLHLDGGTGTLSARLALDRAGGNGALDFEVFGARAQAARRSLRGSVVGRARLAGLDLRNDTADFSGSFVELRDVVVEEGSGSRPWWARVDLAQARVRNADSLDFSGHVQARASDARPLYTLFHAELPRWAERVLTLVNLTAKADVRLRPRFVEVNALEAEGRGLSIEGRYRSGLGSTWGVFLVDGGLLSVAVAIRQDASEVKIFRPRAWYETQIAAPPSEAEGKR